MKNSSDWALWAIILYKDYIMGTYKTIMLCLEALSH